MSVKRNPKISALVVNAIRRLQDVQGSTSKEISNYIAKEYDVHGTDIRRQVQLALRRALSYGILQRAKGGYYVCANDSTKASTGEEVVFAPSMRCKKKKKKKCKCKSKSKSRSRKKMKRKCKAKKKSKRKLKKKKRRMRKSCKQAKKPICCSDMGEKGGSNNNNSSRSNNASLAGSRPNSAGGSSISESSDGRNEDIHEDSQAARESEEALD